MKRNLILAICFCLSLGVNANNVFPDDNKVNTNNRVEKNEVEKSDTQNWEFYSAIKGPTNEELAREANYKFGENAGYLYSMFMDMYVVREEVVPGDPTRRTVIRKPAIYNAVRSLEKYFNKQVKTNGMNLESATNEFLFVLKVAIAAFDSDSKSFEDILQENRKDSSKLTALFQLVQLTEI